MDGSQSFSGSITRTFKYTQLCRALYQNYWAQPPENIWRTLYKKQVRKSYVTLLFKFRIWKYCRFPCLVPNQNPVILQALKRD